MNTNFDFEKYAGCLKNAMRIVDKIEKKATQSYTRETYGRSTDSAYGSGELIGWRYCNRTKYVSVIYLDGRGSIEGKEKKYFIIWIEGIDHLSGEKIKTLTETNHEYTTTMGNALRIREEDKEHVLGMLRRKGIAEWALRNCFVPISYAPKGTLYKK